MLKLILLLLRFSQASELVVWNVGQGQWVTEIHNPFCLHFDMGGEINVTQRALKLCRGKKNYLFVSHWDWDHISFVTRFAVKAPDTCLWKKPLGNTASWKKEYILKIPLCTDAEKKTVSSSLTEISKESHFRIKKRNMNPNDLSLVYQSSSHQVLFPGDSPIQREKQWMAEIRTPVRGIVLGHHGSKTSTSKALLDHLPDVKWAVASARKKKYGHPHAKVVLALKKRRIPLLKTEDWGHLHFIKMPHGRD